MGYLPYIYHKKQARAYFGIDVCRDLLFFQSKNVIKIEKKIEKPISEFSAYHLMKTAMQNLIQIGR